MLNFTSAGRDRQRLRLSRESLASSIQELGRLRGCLPRKRHHSISLPYLVLQASASERSRSSRPRVSGTGYRKVMKIGPISNRGSSDDLSKIKIRKDVAIFEDQIVLGSFFEGGTEGVG